MPDGQVLEFTGVTKSFGDVAAVSDFSARVEPGVVTGFLGPNGAGKTTTLRILLGLVRQTAGRATIGGVPYAELRQPLRTIGFVLEDTTYRPRRTAVRHLMIAAKANGIPLARVGEVLGIVGLADEADLRIGGFSLGMRQRLSVASALLGDPGVLVLDEPANGLDPEGIRWMRLLMRRLADEGRTVLVSSHVLSEVQQVADSLLIISHGRLVFSGGIEDLADPTAGPVAVDATDRASLAGALREAGLEFEVLRSGLNVRGVDAAAIGMIASKAGVVLTSLQQRAPGLEDVFLDLVSGAWQPKAPITAASAIVPAQNDVDPSEAMPTADEHAGSAESESAEDDAGGVEAQGDTDAEPSEDSATHAEDQAHTIFGAAALGATAAGTAGVDERTFDETAFAEATEGTPTRDESVDEPASDADDANADASDADDEATDAESTFSGAEESGPTDSEPAESEAAEPRTTPETGIPGPSDDAATEKVGLAIAAAAREYFAKDAEESLADGDIAESEPDEDDVDGSAVASSSDDADSADDRSDVPSSDADTATGGGASWDVRTEQIPVQDADAASDAPEAWNEAPTGSEPTADSSLDAAAAEFGEQPSFVDPTAESKPEEEGADDEVAAASASEYPDQSGSTAEESAGTENDAVDTGDSDDDSPFTITSLIQAVSTGPVETAEASDENSSDDDDDSRAAAENDDSPSGEHASDNAPR